LGRRVGELHKALATPADSPDFQPVPITSEDIALWRKEALSQVEAAFGQLQQVLPRLTGETKDHAEALLRRSDTCRAVVERLLGGAIAGDKIRIHGDLHLGQVLLAQTDWYIIDFEGEPAKDLETRRRKNSPMKDVAGMMRSFDYAAHAALQRAAVTAGASGTANAGLTFEWRDQSVTAFLEGYREVQEHDYAAHAENLLQVFVLEKACYELCYELANRPDWISIPLQGIAAVLDRLTP